METSPRARLRALEREYAELTASLPAHSLPPAILIRLEDLEDEIAALRATLADSDGENRSKDPS